MRKPKSRTVFAAAFLIFAGGYWFYRGVHSAWRGGVAPRIWPGQNVVVLSTPLPHKVYSMDLYLKMVKATPAPAAAPWWKIWDRSARPPAVTIRAFGSGGLCREFPNMIPGKVGLFPAMGGTAIEHQGVYDGQARFLVTTWPDVDDEDLRIDKNHSARVPGTDLTISVLDIETVSDTRTAANVPGSAGGPVPPSAAGAGASALPHAPSGGASVTFRVKRAGSASRAANQSETPAVKDFVDQQVGHIVRFENHYDIEVDDIHPTQVHFAVQSSGRQEDFQSHGIDCSSPQ